MKNNRIYVAGPLHSSGDPIENVHAAIKIGEELVSLGFIPFIPHLYHYWNEYSPQSPGYWLGLDHTWLETCGALIRLPGHSVGGDMEVQWAYNLGIPVFYGIERVQMITAEVHPARGELSLLVKMEHAEVEYAQKQADIKKFTQADGTVTIPVNIDD